MSSIPAAARDLLRDGTLCYLSAPTREGPHLTPVVYVLDGGRLWATTARRSVKARAWRRDPRTAGLVRLGERAVILRGAITLYDVLDPSTWPTSALRGPALLRASTRFTLKNARFFAGYARDAGRVPLSWTPPGRVVVSVDLDAGVVVEGAEVQERWGAWGGRVESRTGFRRTSGQPGPEGGVPSEVLRAVGSAGPGALGLPTSHGPAVLPASWCRADGTHYAVVSRVLLALTGVAQEGPAALVLDRASSWRAAHMRGILLRGIAQVFDPERVRTGGEALLARAEKAGDLPPDPVIIRIRPRSAVWWLGWSSGTVRRR
jgi:hypothetical protein